MATIIRMPEIAAGDEAARIADWLVEIGDDVSIGQPIAEIETEKATVEFEAETEGRLVKILCEVGALAEVNAPIAVLAAQGQSSEEALAEVGDTPLERKQDAAIEPVVAETDTSDLQGVNDDSPFGGFTSERQFASPIVRKLAREFELNLSGMSGSGPGGRIVRRDLPQLDRPLQTAKVLVPGPSQSVENPTPPEHNPAVVDAKLIPHTRMRRAIARRLVESKASIPHFYLAAECRVDELLALRSKLNAIEGVHVSINDFVLKAVASAFQEVPEANAIWTDDAIHQFDSVDLAIAVAVPSGLLTPVLKGVEKLTLRQLSSESRLLADRAREGKLKQHELEGGSFSVSNLGMFGTREFSAIINPPHSGILAVGATEQRPVVSEDGSIAVGLVMNVTLSADHRVIDGTLAAQWLAVFKSNIEHPLSIIV